MASNGPNCEGINFLMNPNFCLCELILICMNLIRTLSCPRNFDSATDTPECCDATSSKLLLYLEVSHCPSNSSFVLVAIGTANLRSVRSLTLPHSLLTSVATRFPWNTRW